MNSMMGKIQEAQQKLKEAQDSLVNISAEGEAGAGMVKATINGKKQIISVSFDDSLMTKKDKEMLQDLIQVAINEALAKGKEEVNSEMSRAATSLGIPPGFL